MLDCERLDVYQCALRFAAVIAHAHAHAHAHEHEHEHAH
jgi:hypothetical protein